jgi:hypothetical protein
MTTGGYVVRSLRGDPGLWRAIAVRRAKVNEVMDWLNTNFYRDFG